MSENGNTGLIWEFRLALWLPRPLLFGALLFVACFVSIYLGFQWAFDLRVERLPIGYGLTIGVSLTVARFFAAKAADRDEHEGESDVCNPDDAEAQASIFPWTKSVAVALPALWVCWRLPWL